ncbi:polygalacturonase 7 [Genlisea aurea]|uniref:Polygalacturonase 7 n=1 Tax=Genlisea aurea TaxID=192259 RepID=S8EL19_9LAMI|nr:polygalacturonase 7 [Genlisea aurea]
MATGKILRLLILAVSVHFPAHFAAAATVYDVRSFGANRDGKSDSTEAFLSAWAATCAAPGRATIYIPPGKYLLGSVNFTGHGCRSKSITIRMDGTLVAPANYNVIGNNGHWIFFNSVAGVSLYGGTLDGQGKKLWTCKKSGKTCPEGTTSLVFYESSNIRIRGLTSLNSQMFHILIDGCRNVSLVDTKIAAPGSSPNTDGIHVRRSTNVTIVHSNIGTGDDCISIGPGSTHLWIENLSCGPGHGVSKIYSISFNDIIIHLMTSLSV